MRKSIKPVSEKTVLTSIAVASMLCTVTGAVNAQEPVAKTGSVSTTPPVSSSTAPLGEVLALRSVAKADRLKHLDKTKLHRLDWRVTGSGCASCLGRVRKRVDKLNGVYEVAVAIKPPYGVAVIYDASKVSMDEILKAGLKDETIKIEFLDAEDIKIDAPPMLLVPKHNNLVK